MNDTHKEVNLIREEAHQIFHRLVEAMGVGIFLSDVDGKFVYVNQALVTILGYNSKDELLGRFLTQELFVNPSDLQVFSQAISKFGFIRDQEIRSERKDGAFGVLSITSNYIHDKNGAMIGVEGVVHDITVKKRLEDRLEIEKAKLEQILVFDERVSTIHDLNQLMDFIVSKSSEILEANKCSLMILDDQTKELCIKAAKGLSDEIVENTRLKLGESIAGFVAQSRRSVLVRNIEYDPQFARKSRPVYATRSLLSAPILINQHIVGVVNVTDKDAHGITEFSDIDLKVLESIVREAAVAFDNAKLYKDLQQVTNIDALTHICNYRCFVRNLDHEIERVKRFGGKLSLLMLDVDDFKKYNDTYGHLVGDEVLRQIAQTLHQSLRSLDFVNRYGGDEFVAILVGVDGEQAAVAAEKVRKNLSELKFQEPITVSIGIADYQKQFDRLELTGRADRAMYCAKRNGKNKICSYVEGKDMRGCSSER